MKILTLKQPWAPGASPWITSDGRRLGQADPVRLTYGSDKTTASEAIWFSPSSRRA